MLSPPAALRPFLRALWLALLPAAPATCAAARTLLARYGTLEEMLADISR